MSKSHKSVNLGVQISRRNLFHRQPAMQATTSTAGMLISPSGIKRDPISSLTTAVCWAGGGGEDLMCRLALTNEYEWNRKVVPVHILKVHGETEVLLHQFLTLALDGGEWSTSRPGQINHAIEARYPLNKRLDGIQRPSGRFEGETNVFPLPGFEHRTVQPVA